MASSKKQGNTFQKILIVVVTLLFVLSVAGFIWIFIQYKQTKTKVKQLQSLQKRGDMESKEKQKLIKKVEKHMLLPKNEPQIATIMNPEEMKKRGDFFNSVEKGDKLLIYNSKAILYRPSADKIVDVKSVVLEQGNNTAGNQNPDNQRTASDVKPLTLDIRNGTKKPNVASSLATKLDSKNGLKVTKIGKAATTSYKNNLIINQSSRSVEGLSKALRAEVTKDLPQGEVTSTADIIVILGNNSSNN